jgi:hypothetical protein
MRINFDARSINYSLQLVILYKIYKSQHSTPTFNTRNKRSLDNFYYLISQINVNDINRVDTM